MRKMMSSFPKCALNMRKYTITKDKKKVFYTLLFITL